MAHRLGRAFDHLAAGRRFRLEQSLPIAVPELGVAPSAVTVAVRDAGEPRAAAWCTAWGITVEGRGKKLVASGRDQVERAVAAVRRRVAPGDAIALPLRVETPLGDLGPLLDGLGALAPLRLGVAVTTPSPIPATHPETPAWAVERVRAFDLAFAQWERPFDAVRDSLRHAAGHCAALDKVLAPAALVDQSEVLAVDAPAAVATCACGDGIDIDALEVFLAYVIADRLPTFTSGWLEVRVDPTSATVVTARDVQELVDRLAALPREARLAGVRLEILAPTTARVDPAC